MSPGEILEAAGTIILIGVLGFAIRRGSVCAVAATELWIVKRRTARIRAFVVAGASAGVIILPLSWFDPQKFVLALSYPVTVQTLVAGACFGLAARLNRACAFGTLAHLTGGRLAYALTIIGMVGGGVFGSLMLPEGPAGAMSPMTHPSAGAIAAFALFGLLAIPAFRARHYSNLAAAFGGKALLRPMTAMLVIGIVGGYLYAAAGNWTYLSALEREAYPEAAEDSGRLTSALGIVAIVGGGVFAAVRSRRLPGECPVWGRRSGARSAGWGWAWPLLPFPAVMPRSWFMQFQASRSRR